MTRHARPDADGRRGGLWRGSGRRGGANERTGRAQPATRPEHGGRGPAGARRVVQLLLRHSLVDEARLALWLVLRDVPSARPSEARAGALGAGAGAERAAVVGGRSRRGTIGCAARR